MEYVYAYIVGIFVTVCILGFITKGSELDEDDYKTIFGVTVFWPFFMVVGIVVGIPFTIFQLVRGEFNDVIKRDVAWIKAKWHSIGHE